MSAPTKTPIHSFAIELISFMECGFLIQYIEEILAKRTEIISDSIGKITFEYNSKSISVGANDLYLFLVDYDKFESLISSLFLARLAENGKLAKLTPCFNPILDTQIIGGLIGLAFKESIEMLSRKFTGNEIDFREVVAEAFLMEGSATALKSEDVLDRLNNFAETQGLVSLGLNSQPATTPSGNEYVKLFVNKVLECSGLKDAIALAEGLTKLGEIKIHGFLDPELEVTVNGTQLSIEKQDAIEFMNSYNNLTAMVSSLFLAAMKEGGQTGHISATINDLQSLEHFAKVVADEVGILLISTETFLEQLGTKIEKGCKFEPAKIIEELRDFAKTHGINTISGEGVGGIGK